MLAPAGGPVGTSNGNVVLATAKKATLAQELLISGISVGGATIATNPLDVIKTRLQLHSSAGATGERPGLLRTGVTLVREEGALSLTSGMSPAVVRGFLYGGMRLGLYGPCRDALQTVASESSSGNTHSTAGAAAAAPPQGLAALGLKAAAGTISGAVAAGLTSPTELIKTRLQAKGCEAGSAWGVMRQVVAEGGVLALWRGSVPSTARAALLTASQLATYDTVKRDVMSYTGWGDCLTTHFTSSCITGLVTTTVTNPADVLKTRMFVAGGARARGITQTAVDVVRSDGLAGFFKGWTANYARLGPQTVIIFLISETMRNVLGLQGL
ncbi:hypothetical protein PLESTB_000994600 [Pleodorina starrii]|uniref:Uncharacterized protein n=1 Tax=Pleodorina starrii TaxID=330485 RepID=A0A9W6BNZ8_9CHLO|nr:hypothetical protein PLESTM_001853600 [Pleodorina starrii]GLC55503.1 hypothetical protein PLESTB_000994600 [Pleodorina starrii]GLC76384.1 hypothetical protein PLESTF_001774800 [Pleodorina starrii]